MEIVRLRLSMQASRSSQTLFASGQSIIAIRVPSFTELGALLINGQSRQTTYICLYMYVRKFEIGHFIKADLGNTC